MIFKRKSILSNVSFSFVQTFFAIIVTVLINAYIARKLGPEIFGIFTLGLSIVSLFTFLTSLGIRPVTVRRVSKKSIDIEALSIFFSNVICVRVILFILSLLFLLFFLKLLSYTDVVKNVVLILYLGLLFDSIGTTFRDVFQGIERLDFIAFLDIIVRIASALLSFLVLALGFNLYFVAFSYSLASFLSLILGIFLIFKIGIRVNNSFNLNFLTHILKEGFPFLLTGLVSILYLRIDSIIISKLLSEEAVGYYNASANLIARSSVIPDAFASALFPVFIRIVNDKNKFNNLFNSYFRIVLLSGLFLFLTIFLLSDLIILTIYGNEFINSIVIMKIFSLILPFVFLTKLFTCVLQASDCEAVVSKVTWVSVMINILLDFLLVFKFGIAGVAFATLVSQILLCFLLFLRIFKNKIVHFESKIFIKIFFVIIFCIIFEIILKKINICFPIHAFSLIVFFIICVFLSRIYTFEDIKSIFKILKARG